MEIKKEQISEIYSKNFILFLFYLKSKLIIFTGVNLKSGRNNIEIINF